MFKKVQLVRCEWNSLLLNIAQEPPICQVTYDSKTENQFTCTNEGQTKIGSTTHRFRVVEIAVAEK